MKRFVVVFIAVAVFAAAVSAEEGTTTSLETIVVTPSRIEEEIGSASSSITVVTKEDIERKEVDTVAEALMDQVGVDVRQSGVFQGPASLLMRGGKPNHVLIMVDGVKAYDPISTGGEYNLAYLTTDNVEQIEVLRGPQSALYGSDAMSGVVNIISKKPEKAYVNASWEAGSFYTYKEEFEAGSASNGFHYSVAASRMDTKGLSQAQAKKNNQERDPYDKTSVATRADYDIGDIASVGGTLRHTKAHFAYDQGADADDDNAFSIFREDFVTTYASLRPVSWWQNALRLGWMETARLYFDDDWPLAFDFDRSKYAGKAFTLDYQSTFTIRDIDHIIMGYDYTEEAAEFHSENDFSGFMVRDDMAKAMSRIGEFYLENRLNIDDKLTATQGLRVSHHSRAGTHMTYRLDGSYLFPTGTKVRGLIATGFKAPSLYQLYAPVNAFFGGGNATLQPEKSRSYEYGVDQRLLGDKLTASATYFHTLYANLIDALTNPVTFFTDRYINIGKAQVHGLELSATARPIEAVKLTGGFTYQKTWDFQNDQEMIRRPERKLFVECFWQATKKLSFEARVRYNGPMSDNLSNPLWGLNTYKLKEFVVADAVVNYDVTKNFSVYAVFNNIFNKYYEESRGYTTSPFAMYGGVKAKF